MTKKAPAEVAPAETESEEVTGKALDVFNKHGGFVRTYSLEVHGKVFRENAEEFAKKIGGEVKKH